MSTTAAPRSGYGRGAKILSVGIATTGIVTFAPPLSHCPLNGADGPVT